MAEPRWDWLAALLESATTGRPIRPPDNSKARDVAPGVSAAAKEMLQRAVGAPFDYYDIYVAPKLEEIPWWIRWAVPAPENSRDVLGWIDAIQTATPQGATVKLASMPLMFATVHAAKIAEKIKNLGRFIPHGRIGFYRVQDMPPLKVDVPVREPGTRKVVGHQTVTVVSGHGERKGTFMYPMQDITDRNELRKAQNAVASIGAAGGPNSWEIVGEVDLNNPVVVYAPNDMADMLISDLTRKFDPDPGRVQILADSSPGKVQKALGERDTLDPSKVIDKYREFLNWLQRKSEMGELTTRALENYNKQIEAYLNYIDHWKEMPPSQRDRLIRLFEIAKNNPEVVSAKARGSITPDTVFRSMLADRLVAEAAWRQGFDAVVPVSDEIWEVMAKPIHVFRTSKLPAKELTRGGRWMKTVLDLNQPLAVTPVRIYQAGPLGRLRRVKP